MQAETFNFKSGIYNAGEDLHNEARERAEIAAKRLSFGVSYLDDALIGINQSDLILIGGRTGGGKTELATHIAYYNAMKGKRVLFYALEAEKRELSRRIFYKALARKFYKQVIRSAEKPDFAKWYCGLQDHLFKSFYDEVRAETTASLQNLDVRYSDEKFDMNELRKEIVAYGRKYDLICVDHLHYIRFDNDNENQAIKDAMQKIFSLVMDNHVPIILVAHIRKADRGSHALCPEVEDFHGSSDVPKIATKAITIASAAGHVEHDDPRKVFTFMKAVKFRQRGSVSFGVAMVPFDFSTNSYDPTYYFGKSAPGKKGEVFASVKNLPDWAENGQLWVSKQDDLEDAVMGFRR